MLKNGLLFFLVVTWVFLVNGNFDDKVLLAYEQYGLMLVVLVSLLIIMVFSDWMFSLKILLLPFFIGYLFLVSMFFGGEISSLAKVVAFSLVVLLASFCASKMSVEAFLKAVVVSLFLLLSFNILLANFATGIGLEEGKFAGDWKGVFDQKNALGRLSALLMVSATLLFISSRELAVKLCCFLVFVASVFVVLNSGSRTGFATGMLISFLAFFFHMAYTVLNDPKVNGKLFLSVLVLEGFIVVAILLFNAQAVALHTGNDGISVFGKFISLTGRLTIWEYALQQLHGVNLWLGYGLDNLWTMDHFITLGPIEGMGDFYPEDSHNGYVDILAQGGVLGAIIYSVFFAALMLAAYRAKLNAVEFVVFFTFICFFVVSNITESYTTKSTNIVNFIFVYLAAFVFLKEAKQCGGFLFKAPNAKSIKRFAFRSRFQERN